MKKGLRRNSYKRKVFVSYKYRDYDVEALSGVAPPTWPCDYVIYLENHVLAGHIYKGENPYSSLIFMLIAGIIQLIIRTIKEILQYKRYLLL